MPRTERFDIYRNLNKARKDRTRYVWSLRLTGGRVQGHSETALLLNPEFKVSESTRQRIIAKEQRAICAFVRGDLATCPVREFVNVAPEGARVRISFNPYSAPTFYRCDTRAPVTAADAVIFTISGCYAINPR